MRGAAAGARQPPLAWRGTRGRACTPTLLLLGSVRRYFFGTLLSLWNKLLLGKEHGLFDKGAFPGACVSERAGVCERAT